MHIYDDGSNFSPWQSSCPIAVQYLTARSNMLSLVAAWSQGGYPNVSDQRRYAMILPAWLKSYPNFTLLVIHGDQWPVFFIRSFESH